MPAPALLDGPCRRFRAAHIGIGTVVVKMTVGWSVNAFRREVSRSIGLFGVLNIMGDLHLFVLSIC